MAFSVADPYLWASAAALFIGLAFGQATRAALPGLLRRARAARSRSGRISRAIAFLSLGILGVAALLVFADKSALSAALGQGGILLPWAGVVAAAALLAGRRPLAAGLPLALLVLAALGLLRLGLEGWLPLRPAAAGAPVRLAVLLPYEVGPSSFRGHLELQARDSVPVAQELGLASSAAALSVESLELSGPLNLAAGMAGRMASPNFEPRASFYRIVGIAGSGGAYLGFAAPAHVRMIDLFLPLAADSGIQPGGEAVAKAAFFGQARRSRQTSPSAPLAALEPLSFSIDEKGAFTLGKNSH
jgi:hypothetical protein